MKPPQLKSNLVTTHKFRFLSSTNNVQTITAQELITMCGNVAATTTSAYSIWGAVKLKRVSVWAPPPSQGSAITTSCVWSAGTSGQNFVNMEVSDTSNSVATPAVIHTSPPKESQASFWQNVGNNADLFNLVAPTGSIIDVTVDMVLADNELPPIDSTVVAATVGDIYFSGLNGWGGTYAPVSLSTLA
jgi:hypothetical protein